MNNFILIVLNSIGNLNRVKFKFYMSDKEGADVEEVPPGNMINGRQIGAKTTFK